MDIVKSAKSAHAAKLLILLENLLSFFLFFRFGIFLYPITTKGGGDIRSTSLTEMISDFLFKATKIVHIIWAVFVLVFG